MASTTTPQMVLILPDVGTEPGPDWASEIITALTSVDSHDHTSGKGVQIPTAGLAINANLTFNDYAGISLAFIGFTDQGSAPATLRSVYTKSGELYFQDSASNEVQITSNGAINVAAGELTYKLITTYPYNVLITDTNKVLGITTSTARSITLPAATNEIVIYVKDITGSGQTNNITITPNGSDTIDGGASFVIEGDYEQFGFVSDGVSNWHLI